MRRVTTPLITQSPPALNGRGFVPQVAATKARQRLTEARLAQTQPRDCQDVLQPLSNVWTRGRLPDFTFSVTCVDPFLESLVCHSGEDEVALDVMY
jgi:hypothetical protein